MKTIRNFVICLVLIVSQTACNKILDTPLKSGYSPETYYTTDENALMAVNGCYSSMYGTKYWIFGDVASDDAVKGGSAGDQVDINAIDDFSAAADNGVIFTFWQKNYETISQCNNVIEYVSKMSIPNKNRYVAEAKFIRAYTYFWLVNIFGSVPYKDKPQETNEAIHVGLSTTEAIYEKIEQDLNDAMAVLPMSYSSTDLGRATKGAASGLLAKVYLFQGKYPQCLSIIAMLESFGQYNLAKNYTDLFKTGGEDNAEVLFALRFASSTKVNLGNEFVVWMAPNLSDDGAGYGFNQPVQSYVDCFTEKTTDSIPQDDLRLDASIGRDGKPWFNGKTFSASWSTSTGYLVKKYNEDNPTATPIAWMTVPFHILRYADVLLMKAEANNEAGIRDTAFSALNKVRLRAHLAAVATTESRDNLRSIIQVERRRELGFESHRFLDLMRYGKETAELALTGTGFVYENNRYFPIPQAERDGNTAIN